MTAVSTEHLLSDFVYATGTDCHLAKQFLQGENWDLVSALKAFNSLGISEQNCEEPAPGAARVVSAGFTLQNVEHENCSQILKRPHHPAMADLENSEAVEDDSGKRLVRGFSKATENAHLLTNARHYLARGLSQVANSQITSYCHIETPSYTFTLPDLSMFPVDFRRFLEKDLIEVSTLKALESSGHLNWWTNAAQKLWPLATSGDGNCLLHSASLGMWGFHDRLLILRKALYLILAKGSRRHALWRRWRWQQTHMNKESGLVYSEEEWRNEWNSLVRLASSQPRSKPGSAEPVDPDKKDPCVAGELPNQLAMDEEEGEIVYESLEEIHVFALAHVLKRPVVVVADTVLRDSGGEAFAPIPFGGIYLPLECPPAECHRSPLVLTYDAAHFSSLVPMQQSRKSLSTELVLPAVIPLTDKERRLLPLHFASDPGPDFTWWADDADRRIASRTTLTDQQKIELIARYMDILKIPLRRGSIRPDFTRVRNSEPVSGGVKTSRTLPPDSTIKKQPTGLSGSTGRLFAKDDCALRNRPQRKFSLNRLANSLKKKLNNGQKDPETKIPSSKPKPKLPVNMTELKDINLVVGALLHTQAHHQYMQEMVDNYLKAARARFDAEQKTLAAGIGSAGGRSQGAGVRQPRRERISRSFSTSSMVVTCMNGECERTASHATNFLCDDCFRTQKELMSSFSVAGPSAVKLLNGWSEGQMSPIASPLPSRIVREEEERGSMKTASSTSSITVRERKDETEIEQTIERRYGVNAVTTPHGVTHYYLPQVQYCRSPHCSNYSNGHPHLCLSCTKKAP